MNFSGYYRGAFDPNIIVIQLSQHTLLSKIGIWSRGFMRITSLVENTTKSELKAKHGLSFYIL